MHTNPIDMFLEWYKSASACPDIKIPEAMSLSTVLGGQPDSRMVLLKSIDERGFVFYTNIESPKGQALLENPRACLLFYWEPLGRQVRIRGYTERTESKFFEPILTTYMVAQKRISKWLHQKETPSDKTVAEDKQSDSYFTTRSRESQIGAWASQQSQVLDSQESFERQIQDMEKHFEDQAVPRPPFWAGYRLIPHEVEFWTNKKHRYHERLLYTKKGDAEWGTSFLSP